MVMNFRPPGSGGGMRYDKLGIPVPLHTGGGEAKEMLKMVDNAGARIASIVNSLARANYTKQESGLALIALDCAKISKLVTQEDGKIVRVTDIDKDTEDFFLMSNASSVCVDGQARNDFAMVSTGLIYPGALSSARTNPIRKMLSRRDKEQNTESE